MRLAILSLTLGLASCGPAPSRTEDIADLNARDALIKIDDLTSRVDALEGQIEDLEGQVTDLTTTVADNADVASSTSDVLEDQINTHQHY